MAIKQVSIICNLILVPLEDGLGRAKLSQRLVDVVPEPNTSFLKKHPLPNTRDLQEDHLI